MTRSTYGTHTPDEWRRWIRWGGDNYDVTDDGITVARGRTPTYVDPVRLGAEFDRFRTVDIALDECETLYVLTVEEATPDDGDPDRVAVYSDDRSDGVLNRLVDSSTDQGLALPTPRALAVTADTIYLADAGGDLVAVSRSSRAIRKTWDTFVEPVAIVADRRHAYLLDSRPEGGVVFRVGRDVDPVEILPAPEAEPATGLPDPRDVARDDEGNLYVLYRADADPSRPRVNRYDRDDDASRGYVTDPVTTAVPTEFDPVCLDVVGVGEILLGVGTDAVGRRTLVRYLPDRRTFERVSTVEGVFDALGLRRGSHGRSRGLYVLERQTGSEPTTIVAFLEEVRTNRLSEQSGQYDARIVRRFDAGEAAVEWHRVTVEFSLAGAGTQVRLEYFATDEDVSADEVEWRSLGKPNPSDALLPDARGRYLWVSLHVVGTERTSPTVTAFRVQFPRSTYLRYLPSVYREDPDSAAFLERYLSVFETVLSGVEAEIDDLTSLLDVRGIDAAYLDWLESWLALDPDDSWTEENRRRLLEAAPDLFKSRGTRAGLLRLLRLYLDGIDAPAVDTDAWERARAHEAALLDELVDRKVLDPDGRAELLSMYDELSVPPEVELLYLLEDRDLDCIDSAVARETYRRLLPCPQCFVVLVAPYVDAEHRRTVDRIVDAERPAHAVGRGVGLVPWLELGSHSYLGLNSTLPTREFVLERSSLGRDTALVDPDTDEYGGVPSRNGDQPDSRDT